MSEEAYGKEIGYDQKPSLDVKIDWSRMIEPQEDGYDTDILLKLAKQRFNHVPKRMVAEEPNHLWLDDAIYHDWKFTSSGWEDVPTTDNEMVRTLDEVLHTWPALRTAIKNSVDFISFIDKAEMYGASGCTCGHWEAHDYGMGLLTSIFDPWGAAEGLAHEYGHLRFKLYGFALETHDRWLLDNDPKELYVSPIRRDKRRPISAVIHAEMSYIMVSDMDLKWSSKWPDKTYQYLQWNIPRIDKGLEEVEASARPTEEGKQFLEEFLKYGYRVIREGKEYMASYQS